MSSITVFAGRAAALLGLLAAGITLTAPAAGATTTAAPTGAHTATVHGDDIIWD
ncbi:hypothetical protein ACIG0C_02150 [Kitasatospora aureofaciens]|uniref:Uncharacterized protein n=1 Tax=Kitasatospora aureofaciens TaxID=1894 RepID=A0A8H9HHW9_KITAU|nr:hypothetical protein [Kitasatospora aureofaciens]UKZ06764.1 hypothetical protein BOQ63_022520 [Streptomyces viridifaciens]GGU67358.1 hypothetical protein GCM10010502_18100 [Kitasatospora aureofaciens]